MRRSSASCVMFSPASRRKSSYMRETARVALRRSKHAHSARNSLRVLSLRVLSLRVLSLRVLGFIGHPVCSSHEPLQDGSHKSDYTPTAHLLRISLLPTIICAYARTGQVADGRSRRRHKERCMSAIRTGGTAVVAGVSAERGLGAALCRR